MITAQYMLNTRDKSDNSIFDRVVRVMYCAFKDSNTRERIKRLQSIEDAMKVNEQNIRHYIEEMSKKDEIFQQLINNLDCWIWYKDVDGCYVSINEKIRTELFHGLEMSDIIGNTDNEILNILRDKYYNETGLSNGASGKLIDNTTLLGNTAFKFTQHDYLHHNSSRVKLVKTPLFDPDTGNVIGVIGYGYNITEEYNTLEKIASETKDKIAAEAIRKFNNKELYV